MRWMAGLIAVLSLAVSPVTARADVIDQVWAGHPVAFAMAASDRHLFVGYYDADRRLTVAERDIAGGAWRYTRLDIAVGWDSHNYIAMAIDPVRRLHVAANMHVSPLTYYAAAKPDDAESLRRLPVLVDRAREVRMTYPVFLKDRAGRLIFKYRDGGSGNGNDIYTVYDGRAWAPLLNVPLTDGEGKRNAYPVGPVIGPDGQFHMTWVWRETPDAATNHDLSYARSADLVHWQKADGTPIVLPMTYGSAEIVDPVPVGGGMINNNTLIGFDADARPLIAYHKYDAAGHTQIYVARFEEDHWHLVQASNWTGYRWEFGGNGSLVSR
ncbi:BNR repeat-containing protein [Asticcacaulis sp. 201]|uniref:BNR repeat-containing protein n=1 Tax=Asticcacaulis sp. 201 TaxID=3028787 RepID=UPI0029166A63|nr:BNR repeat-containing protein [Asticcacaulis sp. 201]MDV6330302.1 BNR repeat-containing protein [Asticcacaulis sp. 201]